MSKSKMAPAVTKEKVLAIMHLCAGEMTDPVAIGAVVNLFPCQVSEILRSHVEVFRPVKCAKCGATLHAVPCVACKHRRQYPRYQTAFKLAAPAEVA